MFDACANGQQLKCLTVIDEYTREFSLSSARTTRVAGSLVSIPIFSASRLQSSMTLKVRKRRPDDFFENADDLFFRVFRLLHVGLFFWKLYFRMVWIDEDASYRTQAI